MARKPDPERREQFLHSALKLFVANGVQGTSTAAIAREAGTASGTLFLYFPTKQDLINELALEISREQSSYITSLVDPSQSARDIFQTIWIGSLHWFLENMESYQYIQQVRDSGMLSEAVVQESEKYFDYYFDAIQKGLQDGAINPYPIELIGGILYQDIIAVMNLIIRESEKNKRDEYIQTGFKIFWDSIKISSN